MVTWPLVTLSDTMISRLMFVFIESMLMVWLAVALRVSLWIMSEGRVVVVEDVVVVVIWALQDCVQPEVPSSFH